MKISIVIASLGSGGAERIVAILSNRWAAAGARVSIITFNEKGVKPFYDINRSVELEALGLNSPGGGILEKLKLNIRKIKLLRSALERLKPDVVISFIDQTNVAALLAALGSGIPVIVTEHVDRRMYSPGKLWDMLRLALYPLAASVVGVSNGVLSSFPAYIRNSGTVIYNPIVPESPVQTAAPRLAPKKIIAMGRLTGQKGFDLLLKAFAVVAAKNPEWNVEIWGEGELKSELEALRDKLELGSRVVFAGLTDDPYARFRDAGIFVLSSRFEGLGIVLCEAMSQGLPAISFDCPSGPAEIIHDKVSGLLVPAGNTGELAKAMDLLMNDEAERKRLAAGAVEAVRKFDIKNILPVWDRLIETIIRKS